MYALGRKEVYYQKARKRISLKILLDESSKSVQQQQFPTNRLLFFSFFFSSVSFST
jgi:hypothetical protein